MIIWNPTQSAVFGYRRYVIKLFLAVTAALSVFLPSAITASTSNHVNLPTDDLSQSINSSVLLLADNTRISSNLQGNPAAHDHGHGFSLLLVENSLGNAELAQTKVSIEPLVGSAKGDVQAQQKINHALSQLIVSNQELFQSVRSMYYFVVILLVILLVVIVYLGLRGRPGSNDRSKQQTAAESGTARVEAEIPNKLIMSKMDLIGSSIEKVNQRLLQMSSSTYDPEPTRPSSTPQTLDPNALLKSDIEVLRNLYLMHSNLKSANIDADSYSRKVFETIAHAKKSAGVYLIFPKAGDKFDPVRHQGTPLAGSKMASGTIIKLISPGLQFKDEIIDFAKVQYAQ